MLYRNNYSRTIKLLLRFVSKIIQEMKAVHAVNAASTLSYILLTEQAHKKRRNEKAFFNRLNRFVSEAEKFF